MDTSTAFGAIAGTVLIWILLVTGFYVWIAYCLGRIFGKLGEQAWKGWIPFVNTVTVLELGGYNALWVAAFFIPVLNLAGLVIFYIALNNMNKRLGFGPGYTLLAVILYPLYVSLVAFAKPDGALSWVPAGSTRPSDSGTFESGSYPDFAVAPRPAQALPDASNPPAGQAFAAPSAPVSFAPQPSVDPVTPRMPEPAPPFGTVLPPVVAPPAPTSPSPVESDSGWRPPALLNQSPSMPPPPPSVTGPILPPSPPVAQTPAKGPDIAFTPEQSWAPPALDMASAGLPIAPLPAAPAPNVAPPAVAETGDTDATVVSGSTAPTSGDDDNESTVLSVRKQPKWFLDIDGGTRHPLTSTVTIVGRNPVTTESGAVALAITDPSKTLSKTHARLERVADQWFVTDLDSTNGVFLVAPDGTEVEIEKQKPVEATASLLLGELPVTLVQEG
jgi:hypothetical protein